MASETYVPMRITEAPKIDGILDEPLWKTPCPACEMTHLTVILPDTHKPASMRTWFKFAYTDKALYVGVTCEEPKNLQVRRLTARDDTLARRDAVRIMLDPSGQGNYGYLFDIGLGGSIIDGTIRPEKEMNYDWDGPISVATSSDEDHWYAEIALPWDMMQFPYQKGKRRIGVMVRRQIPAIGEFWATPHLPMISSVYLSAFAPMEIENINPRGRLTFYPYVAVGYDGVAGKRQEKAGADIFWQPSPRLLASATFNPDYGDVESDNLVVNLSAVETFYEEKRSFFVEGNDIFKTWRLDNNGLNLVHTRRIGSTPDMPVISDDASVIKTPIRSDIIAAVKATGQVAELRYGFMTAFEDDNYFLIKDPAGIHEITDKSRDFYAARLLYEHNNTKLGYLGTYTANSRYNSLVYYILKSAGVINTPEDRSYDSWVHSIDSDWLSENKKWRLENQLATSNVDGEQGYAWNGRLTYSEIRKQDITLQLDYVDDKFDCNDLGYLERNDRFGFNLEFAKYDTPAPMFQELHWNLFTTGQANEHLIDAMIGGRVMVNFLNLTSATLELDYMPPAWNDNYVPGIWGYNYGYRPYRTVEGYNAAFLFRTNSAKPIRIELQPTVYTEENGGFTKRFRVKFDFDIIDEWQNSITLDYYNKEDWLVWRSADQRLFGYDSNELTVAINSGYQIARNQELRLGIQWVGLDAKGKTAYDIDGDGYLRKNLDGDLNPADRSFDRAKFVAQIRYKYEFAPLSDFYLVYNRGSNLNLSGEKYLGDDFGGLLSDSLSQKDVDLILMKIRYRF